MKRAILMDERDNVATALTDIEANEVVRIVSATGEVVQEVKAKQPIRFGHKIALRTIRAGEDIIKYGEVIGKATQPIQVGEHVHIHNVESKRIPITTILKGEG